MRWGRSQSPAPSPRLDVGARVFGRLRIDQRLRSGDGWSLFLADDEERSELELVVTARERTVLEEQLAELGPALRVTELRGLFVAEVALCERHLELYGEALIAAAPSECAETVGPVSAQPDPCLSEGFVFAARYRIERLLGRGGMGEVYRAHDGIFRRVVALKVLRVDGLAGFDTLSAKTRLLDEARFVASLKHPHIVEIFDAGEADGYPYIVLEACEGGNLKKVIEEDTAPDAARIAWLEQVAKALLFAHERGIVHRDLKPENVLLTTDGTAKLADFGIARALSPELPRRATTGIIGTPRYMAPEQLFGGTIDGRSDQFAWALLAEELLTRVHPRDGSATRRAREIASGLRKVIQRASASDPNARYPTMAPVVASIAGFDGRHAGRHPSPSTAKVAAGAVVAVAALVGGGKIASLRRAADDPITAPRLAQAPSTGSVAETAFREGVQLWADGAASLAEDSFERAIALDPGLPTPHVFYVASSETFDSDVRKHAVSASALRVRLSPLHQALLDALEPELSDQPDLAESDARFQRLLQRADIDEATKLAAAMHFLRARDTEALSGIAASLRAPSSDWLQARADLQHGDADSARAHLRQCISASRHATQCLEWLARLDANDGRCESAEQTSRELVAADPQSPLGYLYLARAVMGQTHSTSATRAVTTSRIDLLPETQRPRVRASTELVLHVYDGDFDAASQSLEDWRRALTPATEPLSRAEEAIWRVELNLELGRVAEASAAARAFDLERRTWLSSDDFDDKIEAARALYLSSSIPRAEYVSRRDAALQGRGRRGGYFTEWVRWYDFFVQTLKTPEDVADALRTEPARAIFPDPLYRDAGVDALLGRFYEVAGRLPEALAALQRATRSCSVGRPLEAIRAHLWLAQVLRRTGDQDGACAASRFVLERWGDDPRSVTAREARDLFPECNLVPNSHKGTRQ